MLRATKADKGQADKRAALLEAAEAVLVERGLSGATVDEITGRAGVAKGTFYLYFSSKDDAIAALQVRLWEDMMATAVDATSQLADADDWWAVVDAFIETVIDFDLEHREWHQLVSQGWSVPFTGEEQNEQQFIDLIAAALRDGNERGVCDVEDPDLYATLLYRAMQGTSHQLCATGAEVDRDQLVAQLKTFVRRVLRPSEDRG